MSRLKLWLVRHGETEVNSGIWSEKPAETRLTVAGKKQAEAAAASVIQPPDLFIVSPLIRAQETMHFFVNCWPDVPMSILPIQEFIYLSPSRLACLAPDIRKEEVNAYWQRNDPYYCDGDDAESFTEFLARVSLFHQQIMQLDGYVVAVGHGQFFKAFQCGLTHGFTIDPMWMKLYREKETTQPIKNGHIVQLSFD